MGVEEDMVKTLWEEVLRGGDEEGGEQGDKAGEGNGDGQAEMGEVIDVDSEDGDVEMGEGGEGEDEPKDEDDDLEDDAYKRDRSLPDTDYDDDGEIDSDGSSDIEILEVRKVQRVMSDNSTSFNSSFAGARTIPPRPWATFSTTLTPTPTRSSSTLEPTDSSVSSPSTSQSVVHLYTRTPSPPSTPRVKRRKGIDHLLAPKPTADEDKAERRPSPKGRATDNVATGPPTIQAIGGDIVSTLEGDDASADPKVQLEKAKDLSQINIHVREAFDRLHAVARNTQEKSPQPASDQNDDEIHHSIRDGSFELALTSFCQQEAKTLHPRSRQRALSVNTSPIRSTERSVQTSGECPSRPTTLRLGAGIGTETVDADALREEVYRLRADKAALTDRLAALLDNNSASSKREANLMRRIGELESMEELCFPLSPGRGD